MTRFLAFGGVRFVLAGMLAFALAACFVGRAEAASVFSSSFAAPAVFANSAAPGAPKKVAGVAGNASVVVSWSAPSSDGGSVITGYTVTASGGGSHTCTTRGDRSCKVPGLTNGKAYTFTVKATNARGNSAASVASAAVTPATAPGAPTSVSGVAGNASVVVSWSAPSSDGGSAITGYTVTASGGGSQACTTATWTSCMVSGLTNGKAYTFTVKATNARGNSAASVASAAVTPTLTPTPATAPGAPTSVSGVAGNTSVVVSWSAPSSDGGSAITGYTVRTSGDSSQACATNGSLSCTVSGLTNGTAYTFTVVATSAIGNSVASVASAAVTPATPPGSPTSVSGVAGDASVVVSWSAPSSNGGSAITGYTVTASGGGSQACTTATLSCTVAAPAVFANSAAPGARVVAGDRALTLNWSAVKGAGAYRVSWRGRVLKGGKPTAAWSKKWLGLKVLKASARSYKATRLVNGRQYQLRLDSKAKAKKSRWVVRSTSVASPIEGKSVGSQTCTTSGALSCSVTGLTNNTAYTFTAVATNARGNSAPSAASAAVTPSGLCLDGRAKCEVGDTGPGGGKVFYAPGGTFTETGAACDSSCRYLEAAPAGWNGGAGSGDPSLMWAGDDGSPFGQCIENPTPGAAGYGIGSGFANTAAIMAACPDSSGGNSAPAAFAAHTYGGGWFLPSLEELNQLDVSGVGGLVSNIVYWSSSQYEGSRCGTCSAWGQIVGNGGGFDWRSIGSKDNANVVRAVRAF